MFEKNKDLYDKSVHDNLSISNIDMINKFKGDYYLLFDESFIVYKNFKFESFGPLYYRKNNKWIFKDKNDKIIDKNPF